MTSDSIPNRETPLFVPDVEMGHGGFLIGDEVSAELLEMLRRPHPLLRNLPPVAIPLHKRLRYQLVFRPRRAISDIWAHLSGRDCSDYPEVW